MPEPSEPDRDSGQSISGRILYIFKNVRDDMSAGLVAAEKGEVERKGGHQKSHESHGAGNPSSHENDREATGRPGTSGR